METFGKASEFQAVPGCGLRCKVSHVGNLLSPPLSNTEVMNRRNSTASTGTFQVTIEGVVADSGEVIPEIIGKNIALDFILELETSCWNTWTFMVKFTNYVLGVPII